jgi:hypothetical protein
MTGLTCLRGKNGQQAVSVEVSDTQDGTHRAVPLVLLPIENTTGLFGPG